VRRDACAFHAVFALQPPLVGAGNGFNVAEKSQFDWMSLSLKATKVARWILILALFGLASMFAADFLLNSSLVNPVELNKFSTVRLIVVGSEPLVNGLKAVIRFKSGEHDFTAYAPLVIAVPIYLAMLFVRKESWRLVGWLDTQRQMRQVQVARPRAQSADGLSFSSTSTDKESRSLLGRMGIKREDERDKLLRELASVKKRLDDTKQRLAFLSVDIVGSTRIKVGQDPLTSEHLFREYRILLEKIFKKFRYRAASWTPDGVMACFPQVDLAYGSAKELLRALPAFNAERNHTNMPVQVRCGLNAGDVHYDDSTPLELLSSRVLDITGHLQKAALPDSVMLTEEVYKEIRDKTGLLPTVNDVDGYKVYSWCAATPKAASQAGGMATSL